MDAETIPDDELACGSACKLPADFVDTDEFSLDYTSIVQMYILGCLLLVLLLILNYVTWRHYSTFLAAVLNDNPKDSGQCSSPRRSLPQT